MKDLNKIDVLSKNESGFLKVIVLPLYKALEGYYSDNAKIKKLAGNIEVNIEKWESINKEATENNGEHPLKDSILILMILLSKKKDPIKKHHRSSIFEKIEIINEEEEISELQESEAISND